MAKELGKLTVAQQKKKDELIYKINALPKMSVGSIGHKMAKERMIFLFIQEQEKVANALIRKAKSGDVRAIVEFFDRLYGKAKETIDFGGNVTFSLKQLAIEREKLQDKLAVSIDNEPIVVSHEEIDRP